MTRNETIIVSGVVAGAICLGIGFLTYNNYSLVGMLMIGPILISLTVVCLVSMKEDGRAFMINYPNGGKWINRGEDGYYWAGINSVLFGLVGVAMIVISIIRRG